MSDDSRVVLRDKKGKFTTRKRKQWLENVAKGAEKLRRLNDTEKTFTFHGRRIVELDTLAKELWCKTCDVPLSLRDTTTEKHHCMASTLEVCCWMCKKHYTVNTCKLQRSATEAAHYPVNGKMVIAMHDTGIGPCKVNFSSTYNVECGKEIAASGDEVLVAFNLETSGGSAQATEICQFAAGTHEGQVFNRYIVPDFGISKAASLVTGLHVHDQRLYLQDEKVEAVSLKQALQDFIAFLEGTGGSKKTILVAHNSFRFDMPILLRHLQSRELLEEFIIKNPMFSDSLLVLRENLISRRNEKRSFSLTSLVEEFLGVEALTGAHNASIDVENLLKIIDKCDISSSIVKRAKSVQTLLQEEEKNFEIEATKITLEPLKISTLMKNRLATHKISFETLLNIFNTDSDVGIKFLLSESVDGKPRITKNRRVIDQIIQELKRFTKKEDVNNNEEIFCELNSDFEQNENDCKEVGECDFDDFDVYEYANYEL